MIFKNTGKIAEDLYMIGHPALPTYLLDSNTCPVLFDSGISIMGNRYIEDIKTILKHRKPTFLLLTHSHFDHCGSAGILKRAFPEMEILASPLASAVLKRPNALELIQKLTNEARSLACGLGVTESIVPDFAPFSIDRTVSDGDILHLGPDLSIHILATPGHTRDSLSFFIPERKILIPSEALGIPDATGYIITECLSNYDQYTISLLKLKSLNPETLCLGHYRAFSGKDASQYIDDSLTNCREFKGRLSTFLLEEKGDMDLVRQRFKALEWDGKREDAHPLPAYFINLDARIQAVLSSKLDISRE